MSRAEHRQVACTHLSVTRLFDALDSQKCQLCGRRSPFGWLYRCTQDHDNFLPESDFRSAARESSDATLGGNDLTNQLSQGILRGIENRAYGAQHVRLLQAQKLRVREFIDTQEQTSENASKPSLTYEDPSSSAIGLRHRRANFHSQPTVKLSTNRQGADQNLPAVPKKSYATPLVVTCHFKCCHSCRPAYRDRAFQSLNAILAEPFKQPPPWELGNRRISDANVLKGVAKPCPRPQLRRIYQTLDDFSDVTRFPAFGSSGDGEADKGVNDRKDHVSHANAFKQTIRKALGAVDQSKHISRSSKQSSESSSRESLVQMSRSMLFKRHKKPADMADQIISSRALQESLVLMLAVNTPLPCASDDSDSLDGGEVKVEDGVAVTEEGVGMSAADIIMQA